MVHDTRESSDRQSTFLYYVESCWGIDLRAPLLKMRGRGRTTRKQPAGLPALLTSILWSWCSRRPDHVQKAIGRTAKSYLKRTILPKVEGAFSATCTERHIRGTQNQNFGKQRGAVRSFHGFGDVSQNVRAPEVYETPLHAAKRVFNTPCKRDVSF